MKYYKLALVSFVILFLELLLIRLIGTEVRIFAYLSNLLLLATFVGSGIGMLVKRKFSLQVSFILLLIIVLLVRVGLFSGITDLLASLNENIIWFQSDVSSLGGVTVGLALTLLLFFLVLFVFVPLGQYLGRLFESSTGIILAYSINVAASIFGMWAFYALSWLAFSPFVGIIVIQLALIWLIEGKKHWPAVVSVIVLTIVVGWGVPDQTSGWIKTVWSPYQKLSLFEYSKDDLTHSGYLLNVNGVTYMGLYDLSEERRSWIEDQVKNVTLSKTYNARFADQYQLPYLIKAGVKDALIIGAGGGNDVAAAVRADVMAIDAVEIDPQIIKLGQEYHPEKPYASERVNTIIADGRTFLNQTSKRYDLVVMGLADSHTLSSTLTNIRLDHYLYTQESLAAVKKTLKPDGLLYLSFDVNEKSGAGAKIAKNLRTVFGHEPIIFELRDTTFFGLGGVIFITGSQAGNTERYLSANPDLQKFITNRLVSYDTNIRPLTDNWPYLYLKQPQIPSIYLWVSLCLILLFLAWHRMASWQGNFRWDFFALGAGFLLYEFQNVSKTGLLFGSTWVTNLFTITAILLFILLANLIQAKYPMSLKLAYGGLVLSFGAQLLVPLEALNALAFYSKVIWGSLFLNLPLFFSAVIFITLFRQAKEKSAAFASNLIGSAAGGLLEVLSFLWGIQSLLFIALGFYLVTIPLLMQSRKALRLTPFAMEIKRP